MDLQEWKNMLIPYEYAVEELKVKFKNIRKELVGGGEYAPIEFITGRVKKISSIIDKAKRLDVDEKDIGTKIEDIAGIRIMCQFVEDIYTVVGYIKSRKDMMVLYEKDYITNAKVSGYRSYHLIIKYPIQTVNGLVEILAEIQIRTLAMNFWATIEHSLKYKYDDYLPEELAERLKKSADAAFLLDKEMSSIREEIVSAQVMFELKSVAVQEIIYSIHELEKLGQLKDAEAYRSRFNEVRNSSDMAELLEIQNSIHSLLHRLKN